MKYAKVAVEAATFSFDKAFDYIIPSELEDAAKKGCRVTVPFGNVNKKLMGNSVFSALHRISGTFLYNFPS